MSGEQVEDPRFSKRTGLAQTVVKTQMTPISSPLPSFSVVPYCSIMTLAS